MAEILRAAAKEMAAAARWYETRRPGLGDLFLDEIVRSIVRIEDAPMHGAPLIAPRVPLGVRRQSIDGFPYFIAYVTAPALTILAVAHMSRRPAYWIKRLPASR